MIRQATEKDYEDIAILANQLWTNSDLLFEKIIR